MHETEKIERKKNLKKKMSLRNCSNHLLILRLFSQTLLIDRRKALVLIHNEDIIFDKRSTRFLQSKSTLFLR